MNMQKYPTLRDFDEKGGDIGHLQDESDDNVICLKSVPKMIDNYELKEILQKFGNVSRVTNSAVYRFANGVSKSSMESIFNGMKGNKWGIKLSKYENPSNQTVKIDQNRRNNNTVQPSYNQNRSQHLNNRNPRDRSRRRSYTPGQNQEENRNRNFANEGLANNNPIAKSYQSENNSTLSLLGQPEPLINGCLDNNKCFVCSKEAKKCCERCEELYCSILCQNIDWRKHKFVCFKKPSLKDIQNISPTQHQQSRSNGYNRYHTSRRNNSNLNMPFSKPLHTENINENNAVNVCPPNLSKDNKHAAQQKPAGNSNNNANVEKRNENINCNTNLITPLTTEIKKPEPIQFVPKQLEKASLPMSGQQVVVTHFENSNVVYVRSDDKKDSDEYVKILRLVSSSGRSSKTLTKPPEKGDYAISQYEGEWCRVIVLYVKSNNEIFVGFVDFGNVETKKLSELREMQPECYDIKRYPCCVVLKNVPDSELNFECKKLWNNLISTNTCLKIIYKDNEMKKNLHEVELFEFQTNKSINAKIVELLTPSQPVLDENPLFLEDLKYIKFQPSEKTELIVLDNSLIDAGIISCILKENSAKLDEFVEKLGEYCKKNPKPYSPKEGELCVVKINSDTWYRACCETVLDERLELTLVDLGSIHNVSSDDVRKYPNDLQNPCFTNTCFINGLQTAAVNDEIDNEAKEKLNQLIKCYDILCIPKIDLIDGENFITLPSDIIESIIEKNIVNYNDSE